MHIQNNIFDRFVEIIDYINTKESISIENDPLSNVSVGRTFNLDNKINILEFTEEEIGNVLSKTGNPDPAQRPNCFSCGYPTCRNKAIAVLQDMAELEMCIPYMRRFAESKASYILEASPYGVITLNDKYEVTSMNKAFRKFFIATDSALGKPISHIMDPDPFYQLATNDVEKYECTIKHEKYSIVCYQVIYKLVETNSFVGMFVDVTKNIDNESKLDELRKNTLEQAKELLAQQIQMATGISKILGENTAYSEALLDNLIKFTQGEITHSDSSYENSNYEKGWLWDTNISK
jgi:uncharacterized Fe-S cluster-containing protein